MAHTDHHLFAHIHPPNTHTHAAITAAEVPALHFHRHLGGCLVRGRGGKGWDKSNTKVQFKRCWHGNAELGPGIECWGGDTLRNTHHLFFWRSGRLKWVWHGTSSAGVPYGGVRKRGKWNNHTGFYECSTSSEQGAPFRAETWSFILSSFFIRPPPTSSSTSSSLVFIWPLGSVCVCVCACVCVCVCVHPPSLLPPRGAVCHSAWSSRKRGERGLIELI